MKRKESETFFMVRGPKGLAPYYGTTRTKIEMRARLERDGAADRLGFKIVRVIVTPAAAERADRGNGIEERAE